jgi:HEAT repeat protein
MPPFAILGRSLPLLLVACAAAPAPFSLPPLDAERSKQLQAAEQAFLREHEDYPARRAAIAADPVAAGWFTRRFVLDMFRVREGRPLGEDEDLLRAAAKVRDPVEQRAKGELQLLGAAAVPVLVGDLLCHEAPLSRELGVELLVAVGEPALPALHEVVASGSPRQRGAAVRAVAAIARGPEQLAWLSGLAADADFMVRADVARALRGTGPGSADLLRRMVREDADAYVRRQAARSLVAHAEPASAVALVDFLERCKQDLDPEGEEIAQKGLQRFARSRGPRTVDAWRTWARDWRGSGATSAAPRTGS